MLSRALLLILLLPAAAGADDNPLLVGRALTDGRAFATTRSLADSVGQRMAGSPAADRAVAWAIAELQRAGLANVRREPVKVPRWIRGDIFVEIAGPRAERLHAVALGPSVGTPPAGITAEVVEVASFDELHALGDKARGRIVLFNRAMERGNSFAGYGAVVPLRSGGAVEAAKLGAVATLVRSVGTGAYRLPHTGGMRYQAGVSKIPAAALAAEDADLIHRLLADGPVRVKMVLGCRDAGEVESANVVGEVPGRDRADEVVLLGAHLDSWDLGPGALDDAAGVGVVIEAARLLRELPQGPRRTVRVVLFMNEERGLSGAKAYAEQHAAELPRHVAAMEVDSGAGRPLGFVVAGGAPSLGLVKSLAAPLAAVGADAVTATPEAGADLLPIQAHGVPVVGLSQDITTYFDWHHTAADTVDKIEPLALALDAAAVAVVARGLADTDERLPPSPPPTWK